MRRRRKKKKINSWCDNDRMIKKRRNKMNKGGNRMMSAIWSFSLHLICIMKYLT